MEMLKDILKVLENDAHTTSKQIATMTGTSAAEVTKTIKQAEKDRIILKYKAVVNWDRLEDDQVWALIEVKVKPEPEAGFDSIAGRIAQFTQVRSLYLASGTYDLLLVVVDKSERKIADFVSQNLAHIEGVQGTVSHFVLKRYKEDGELLDGGEAVKRQPVVL
jgi:DNA-binding Lrp family transcriptional regulator